MELGEREKGGPLLANGLSVGWEVVSGVAGWVGGQSTHFRSQFATRTAGPLTMTLCLFLTEARECLTLEVPERFFLR